jgi:paraquat-inducible protein B
MSVKPNKAVIGGFVLGAICLMVVGVATFGSGKLFTPTKKFVMYFDGSVKGLSVGAPVVFRGVKVGSVIDIILQGNLKNMTFSVPIIAEIDLNRFRVTNMESDDADYYKVLIDKGLRAQLQPQSLVTGQLTINFDFQPDKPAHLIADTTGYPQIPTIPSTADEFVRKMEEIPLKQLIESVNSVLGGLERLVNSPDLQDAPRSLKLVVADARTTLQRIDREVGSIALDTRGAISAATATINHADRVLAFETGAPAEVLKNVNQTLADTRESLHKLDETLDSIRNVVTDERSTYLLRQSLKNLGETSRSLGILVDYLDRHPEALLRGKTNLEEK